MKHLLLALWLLPVTWLSAQEQQPFSLLDQFDQFETAEDFFEHRYVKIKALLQHYRSQKSQETGVKIGTEYIGLSSKLSTLLNLYGSEDMHSEFLNRGFPKVELGKLSYFMDSGEYDFIQHNNAQPALTAKDSLRLIKLFEGARYDKQTEQKARKLILENIKKRQEIGLRFRDEWAKQVLVNFSRQAQRVLVSMLDELMLQGQSQIFGIWKRPEEMVEEELQNLKLVIEMGKLQELKAHVWKMTEMDDVFKINLEVQQ